MQFNLSSPTMSRHYNTTSKQQRLRDSLALLIIVTLLSPIISAQNASCTGSNEYTNVFDCSNLNLKDPVKSLINTEVLIYAKSINYSNNAIEILPNFKFIEFEATVQALDFSHNNIERVFIKAFFCKDEKHMPLEWLNLAHNRIYLLPWRSLMTFSYLKYVDLSYNRFKEFNDGDIFNVLDAVQKIYVKELILSHNQIEHVNPLTLVHFVSLESLDLSNNRIKSIEAKFGTLRPSLTQIHLFKNPLECTCSLVWLKEFWTRHKYTTETLCSVNTLPVHEDRWIVKDFKSVVSADTLVKVAELNNPNNLSNQTEPPVKQARMINMVKETYGCVTLNKSNVKIISNTKTVILECQVESYPRVEMRWLTNSRVLERQSDQSDKWIVTKIEREFNKSQETGLYRSTSRAIIHWLTSQYKAESFDCRSFFEDQIDSSQTVVYNGQFDINFSGSKISDSSSMGLISRDGQYAEYFRSIPFIYWIILAICLLFSTLVILFAIFCIVRSNRNYNKRKRRMLNAASTTGGTIRHSTRSGGSGEYYYESINNKRSAIYMRTNETSSTNGSHSTSANSKYLLLKPAPTIPPMKPIVIRDHQDYSSIYSEVNNTQSTSTGPGPIGAHLYNPNHSMSTTISGSTSPNDLSQEMRRHMAAPREAPINQDLSFDMDPLMDASFLPLSRQNARRHLMPTTSSDNTSTTDSSDSSSTRLFEENFEEYQDPKFDDLRKPRSSSQRPTTHNDSVDTYRN